MTKFDDCSSVDDEWEKVEDEMRQARDDIVCATLEMGNGHTLVGTISFNTLVIGYYDYHLMTNIA